MARLTRGEVLPPFQGESALLELTQGFRPGLFSHNAYGILTNRKSDTHLGYHEGAPPSFAKASADGSTLKSPLSTPASECTPDFAVRILSVRPDPGGRLVRRRPSRRS